MRPLIPNMRMMGPMTIQNPQNNQNHEVGAPFNQQNSAFDQKSIRKSFIIKVYSILLFQLLITTSSAVAAYNIEQITEFLQANTWIAIIGGILFIVGTITLGCFKKIARSVPINYILLILLTLGMSISV